MGIAPSKGGAIAAMAPLLSPAEMGRIICFADLDTMPAMAGRGARRLASWGKGKMKDGIHPKYMQTKVTCGCGSSFITRSTKPELKVDICNACHPFYTGKLKYLDTAGRIERFKTKFGQAGYSSVQRGKKKMVPATPPAVAPEG